MLNTTLTQITNSLKNRDLSEQEISRIIENFKCVYDELTAQNRVSGITHKEVQEILYQNNFVMKIASIVYVENYNKSTFTLEEFEDFCNNVEHRIVYEKVNKEQ